MNKFLIFAVLIFSLVFAFNTSSAEAQTAFTSSCPSSGYTWMNQVLSCTVGGTCTFDSQCASQGLVCNLSQTSPSCLCGASSGGIGSCCNPFTNTTYFATLDTANKLVQCVGNGAKIGKTYNPGPIWDWFDGATKQQTFQYELVFPNGCKYNAGILADQYNRYPQGSTQRIQTDANLYNTCINRGSTTGTTPPSTGTTPTIPTTGGTGTTGTGGTSSTQAYNAYVYKALSELIQKTQLMLQSGQTTTPGGTGQTAIQTQTSSQYISEVVTLLKNIVTMMSSYLNQTQQTP